MKTEHEKSGAYTATTSTSAPSSRNDSDEKASRTPKPGEPAPTSDESAFLAQQAADARAAISRTLSEIGAALGSGASVGNLTRQYPWLTLGASTVAGFVATAVLVPSKEDQALKKLARIERALNPPPPPKPESSAPMSAEGANQYKAGHQSFMRTVMGEVIKAVQPAVVSLLTAGVTAQAAKPSQEEIKAQAEAAVQDQQGGPPGG